MKRSACLLAFTAIVIGFDAGAAGRIVSPGDFFPEYRFSSNVSSEDAAYLGITGEIPNSAGFMLSDVWGDVMVLELFNRFCFGCRQGAPIVNGAYGRVASEPALSTRVRFMGVGVGNSAATVDDYREEFEVPFPLLPDPKFGILEALGNPGGTPYTMIIRRTSEGMMVIKTHFGIYDTSEQLVDDIREVLTSDVSTLLAAVEPVQVSPWIEDGLKPPLSEEDIMDRVEAAMERAGYGTVGLYTVDLPDGGKVFVGDSKRGRAFARLVSRLPLCDVCHPVHFILTVDSSGKVVDFEPVSITKYWNKPWTSKDVAKIRGRLLGLSVLEDRRFDPEVDAVSTATMSSALIFDSLTRTGPIMEVLRKMGHL